MSKIRDDPVYLCRGDRMKGDRQMCSWPGGWDALLVDDEAVVRHTYVAQLQQIGCRCYSAASYDEALAVLGRESGIRLVVTDHGVHGDSTQEFVHSIRESSPDMVIVGSSGSDCRAELARLGIERFLKKPWRIGELYNLLSRAVTECVGCESPLPLRLPFPGEPGEGWVCSHCGEQYQAILDRYAPQQLLTFVRRLHPD